MTVQTAPQPTEKAVSTRIVNSSFAEGAARYQAHALELNKLDFIEVDEHASDAEFERFCWTITDIATMQIETAEDAAFAAEILKSEILIFDDGDENPSSFSEMTNGKVFGAGFKLLQGLLTYVQQGLADREDIRELRTAAEAYRAGRLKSQEEAQRNLDKPETEPRVLPTVLSAVELAAKDYANAFSTYVHAEAELGPVTEVNDEDDVTAKPFETVQDKLAASAAQPIQTLNDAFLALELFRIEMTAFFDGRGEVLEKLYEAEGLIVEGSEWKLLCNVLRFVEHQMRHNHISADLANQVAVLMDINRQRRHKIEEELSGLEEVWRVGGDPRPDLVPRSTSGAGFVDASERRRAGAFNKIAEQRSTPALAAAE